MGRIDIIVFPDGRREIFGQLNPAPAERLEGAIDVFLASLPQGQSPRAFTGLYSATNASDITWQPYDPDDPIPLPEPDHPFPDPPV